MRFPRQAIPAVAAVLAIGSAGCGSSNARKSASRPPGGAAAGTAQGGCSQVSAPTPKGPEHLRRPTLRLDPKRRWTERLVTNCGEIDITLDVRAAPRTAASIVYLTRRGFFDGLTFHRVASQPDGTPFVIQGGDPLGDGSGGPGYTVVEPPPAGTRYVHGTVAMAKTQTDPRGASGSQFFIVSGAAAPLPPDYALLGEVSAGDDVVRRIAALKTDPGERPLSPVVIEHALVSAG